LTAKAKQYILVYTRCPKQYIHADHGFCKRLVAGFNERCEWQNYEPAC